MHRLEEGEASTRVPTTGHGCSSSTRVRAEQEASSVVRLKRYGRKRVVIVHEQEDLSDNPRVLLSAARHWESGRVMEMRLAQDHSCEHILEVLMPA